MSDQSWLVRQMDRAVEEVKNWDESKKSSMRYSASAASINKFGKESEVLAATKTEKLLE